LGTPLPHTITVGDNPPSHHYSWGHPTSHTITVGDTIPSHHYSWKTPLPHTITVGHHSLILLQLGSPLPHTITVGDNHPSHHYSWELYPIHNFTLHLGTPVHPLPCPPNSWGTFLNFYSRVKPPSPPIKHSYILRFFITICSPIRSNFGDTHMPHTKNVCGICRYTMHTYLNLSIY
jgi:hypothetical protein